MDQSSIDRSLLQGIHDAVETGNKKRLNSLLVSQQNKGYFPGPNLLPPTDRARDLLDLFTASLSNPPAAKIPVLSVDQILRALLMVYPCYETPWMTTCEFATRCLNLEINTLYGCVSGVECFLGQIRDLYPSNPNPHDSTSTKAAASTSLSGSGRAWLVRLTKTLTDNLLKPSYVEHFSDRTTGGGCSQILSELLRTVVFLAHDLDDHFFQDIMEAIFHRDPHPTRILTWIRLTALTVPFLRFTEIERIRKTLFGRLNQATIEIPFNDLADILEISVDLANTRAPLLNEDDQQSMPLIWRLIPLYALKAVSRHAKLYSELERRLRLALDTLASSDLEKWVAAMSRSSDQEALSEWVRSNVMLLLFQTLQNSGARTVSRLVGRALGKSPPSNDIVLDCYRCILNAAFPVDHKVVCRDLGLSGDIETDKIQIFKVVGGLSYLGRGVFVDQDGDKIDILTKTGQKLLNSIFLGDTSPEAEPNEEAGVGRRALQWLEVADCIIKASTTLRSSQAILFGVVAMTVVYFEMPSSRVSFVQSLSTDLSENGEDRTSSNTYLAAATLIAQSASVNGKSTNQQSDVLEPLCDLLLDPLPQDIFRQLILSLSSIRKAREAILLSSERLLECALAAGWNDQEMEDRSFDGQNIQGGLFGLLELVRRPCWGNEEIEAWKLLSNCIVMDTPPLPASDRLWLYEQINDLIKNEELSPRASEHFLRAAIVRSSSFLQKEPSDSGTRFALEKAFVVWEEANTRQVEDVVALHRLILSLLCHLSQSEEESDARSTLFARGREALLRSILSYKDKSDVNNHRSISNFLRSSSPDGTNHDDFTVNCCTSVCLLAHILDYLMRGKSRNTKRSLTSSKTLDLPGMQTGIAQIISREVESLVSFSSGNSKEESFPSWCKDINDTSELTTSHEVVVDSSTLLPLQLSLFDFMIEVLFTPRIPTRRLQNNLKPISRRIILAVGHLLRSKRSLAAANGRSENEEQFCSLNSQTVNRTGVEFFSAASLVIQDFISQNAGLSDAEELLIPVVQYCKALQGLADDAQVSTCPVLLKRIWALYQVIGGERASTQFIAYLEAHFSDDVSNTETDNSDCSLRSIRNGEDVDSSVQHIRLSVIHALQSCFQLSSSLHRDQPSRDSHLIEPVTPDIEMANSSGVRMPFIASVIEALASDLRAGLDGKSGGITPELFLAFSAAIQECASLLYENAMSTRMGIYPSMWRVFMQVAETLADIVTTFPLDDAVLFRTSFMMAAAELPSMCREILRKSFIQPKSPLPDFTIAFSIDRTLISDTFKDSLIILTRWSSVRDPNSVPWVDIAGKTHLEHVDDTIGVAKDHIFDSSGDGSSTEGAETQHEIPLIVHVPTADSEDEKRRANRSYKIRLRTKAIWSWALSCTLVALEEKWRESFRVMIQDARRDSDYVELEDNPHCLAFFRERRNDLSSCFLSVGKFFQSSSPDKQVDASDHQVILEMLAMNLPSAPRLRFCCILATIAKVLNHSIELFCSYLRNERGVLHKTHTTLAFLESVCNISAWLCLNDRNIDFSVGIFRWLSILKRKRPPGEHPSKRADAADLLPRLSQVVILVRSLRSGLQKIEHSLNVLKQRNPAERVEVVDILFGGGLDSMLRLVAVKLKLLEQAIPPDDQIHSLPDFPIIEDNGKKKRTRRTITGRPRKRATARSRNRMVNVFMNLDQGDAGGDEGGAGDAYVDLEDFIVDG
jgi:hypothetical protein